MWRRAVADAIGAPHHHRRGAWIIRRQNKKPDDGHQTSLQKLYEGQRGKYAFCATTVKALHGWQCAFRRALRAARGLNRLQDDYRHHNARAERVAREVLDGYIRERWHLEVEPGLFLPFYVLQPDQGQGPKPLVLCPHGHNPPHIYVGLYDSKAEQRSIRKGERDIAVQAVREGSIVIAPTARGFGETRTKEDEAARKLSSCRTQ